MKPAIPSEGTPSPIPSTPAEAAEWLRGPAPGGEAYTDHTPALVPTLPPLRLACPGCGEILAEREPGAMRALTEAHGSSCGPLREWVWIAERSAAAAADAANRTKAAQGSLVGGEGR